MNGNDKPYTWEDTPLEELGRLDKLEIRDEATGQVLFVHYFSSDADAEA